MKQLLFLLLFPAFAMAQYPGNAGQKITLGEQTTADGLVYRGLASDTTRKPSVDTMAYILLDTNTNIIWQYKKATSNAWTRVGGSISSGLTGVLPVANGGTNVTSLTNNGILYGSSTSQVATSSALTFDGTNFSTTGTATATKFIPTGTSASGNGLYLPVDNNISISTAGTENLRLTEKGNLGLGSDPDPISSNNYKSIVLQGVTGGEIYLNNSTTNVGYIYANINGAVLDGKGTFRFQTNAVDRLIVYSGGNVGIGTQIPSTGDSATAKLHVVGSARITGAYDNTDGGAANVFVTTTGVLKRSTSSIKYKTEVEDYNKGLSDVLKLRPVTYKSINTNDNKIYAGFIAEELSDLKLGELLQNNEENEPDAISYAYMVTLLTKAIQEQQQQIENLKKRLLTLENK